MRRTYVVQDTAKGVADTSSSNISERVLDAIFGRVFACALETVCLRSRSPKHADGNA